MPITPPPAPEAVAAQLALFDDAGQAPPARAGRSAAWRHPRANRECCLGEAVVAYEFRRARRRTIGLVVNAQGLSVRAPAWVPEAEVLRFLLSKSGWVVDKLRQQASRPAPAMVWRDGAVVDFLGQPLTLSLDPSHRFDGAGAAQVGQRLCVALPQDCGAERLREAVHAWLQAQAQAWFVRRLDHFAPQVGVRWSRFRLSRATTRWGSAKADGSIALHWRLIQLAPDLIDYVVVHELCHLREMNHGPAFWRLVEQVLPDQAQRRQALRRVTLLTLT